MTCEWCRQKKAETKVNISRTQRPQILKVCHACAQTINRAKNRPHIPVSVMISRGRG